MANEFVRHARKVLDTDWRTAEQMIANAVRIKPELEVPADLVTSVEQVKREVEFGDVLSAADALISQQNWNDARRKLEQARLRFAGEQRILERLAVVQNEIKQIELRQLREKVLADLRQVRSEAEGTTKRKRLSVLLDATQRIAQLEYADDQIRSEAVAIVALLQAKISEQERRPKPKQPAPIPPEPPPARIEPPEGPIPPKRGILKPALVAAAVVAIAALVFWFTFGPQNTDVSVELSGTPDGVSIAVNGASCVTPNCKLRLAPGSYTIEAKKEGFASKSIPLTIAKGDTKPVTVAVNLDPVAPVIQVATNLDSGEISIDGRSAGTVKNGQFQLPSLEAGKHTLKLVGTDSEAIIPFEIANEKSPEVASRPLAKNVTAVVVTNGGSSGRVVSK